MFNNNFLLGGTSGTPKLHDANSWESKELYNYNWNLYINSIFWHPGGLKFYVVDNQNDWLFEYTVTTAWDIQTAVNTQSMSLIEFTASFSGNIFFNQDGTKLIVGAYGSYNGIRSCDLAVVTLPTPWVLVRGGYDFVQVAAEGELIRSFKLTDDGLNLYVSLTNEVRLYKLASPFNIWSKVLHSNFAISESYPVIQISKDGKKLYLATPMSGLIKEYSMITANDLTALVLTDTGTNITDSVLAFCFSGDGKFLYTADAFSGIRRAKLT